MTDEPTEMPCVFRPPPLHQIARAAWADPGVRAQAIEALERFRGYCSRPLPRVPGCDTVIRMAVRIQGGSSVDVAAAWEYSYRWRLFLDAWINHTETRSRSRFDHGPVIHPAPHPLGL
ncbi:MAG: hypothetical protein H2055_06880 [Sphingopyxis sp.]|nr:hypothetical protein [Sphingopyxis sp.]